MGFFDLKAICGVCGKEVGMNRFKVLKSNAWVCPECIKKAGGVTQVNVSKVTIEELKELVYATEQRQNKREENLTKNPLQLAEGMYDYCIKNGFGSGWNETWGIKHFQVIENALLSNEEVIMTFIGLHNYKSSTEHDQHFAYAITNKRIIMAQKNMVAGEKIQTVYLDFINDITFNSGVLLGVLTIDTNKEVFNVGLDKLSAQKINAKVLEVFDNLKSAKNQSAATINSGVSVAEEIKKFKELLDIGAITQEEFDIKKKQLLGL